MEADVMSIVSRLFGSGQERELKLVDFAKLEALIKGAPLDDSQKEYLKERWVHQIRWWDKTAWEARRRYFLLRSIIVLGGVIVPFLTTASFTEHMETWRRAGALASLLVAACAALEALYSWGGIWLDKRRAAELLKVEGWLFLNGAGRYNKGQAGTAAFAEFVAEAEKQIAAEVGSYIAVAQPPPKPPDH